MKKLVTSAFALALTAGLGQASEDEWSQLDREVEALTSSLSLADGVGLSGWLRTNYHNSGDIDIDDNDGDFNDLGGFDVPDARLIWDGSHGDYGFTIQYDVANSGMEDRLLDAFVTFPIGGAITGTAGQFKAPVLHEAAMSSRDTFFPTKSANSAAWTARDTGFMLSGDFDTVGWYLTAQNGTDDEGDELFIAARGEVTLMGEGAGMVGGAYGGPDSPSATIGGAFFDNGQSGDGDGFAIDGYFATNTYSFSGEYVDLGDDVVDHGVGGYGDLNFDPNNGT
ncbi:MAG: porin, partial [Planctomycetota bacterium]|nr:porin [Planctomycetota bacterium]